MTKRTFFCGFLILTSALAGTSLAWADPSPTDKAASDVLFKDAKQLVAAGRVNEACPKFEESERLDPTPGTLLNLGDCYKGASPPRTASAWGAYRQAEAMARQRGDAARQEGAALRAQALEPLLSKVTIVVPVAARVDGLVVKWDGRAVGEGLFGSAFPADAGEHKIEAEAPGKSNWTSTVRVQANAETTVTTMPTLAVAPAGAAGDGGPRPFWNTARYVGAGIGAAGLVGVVVGSIFGIKAANKNSESLPHCLPNNSKRCDSQGVALGADALAAAKVSTLAFVIGGAALVGGTIVFLTAPSGAPQNKSGLHRLEAQSVVGLGFGGMTLRGEW